jgi:hypothetical protein
LYWIAGQDGFLIAMWSLILSLEIYHYLFKNAGTRPNMSNMVSTL